MEFTSSLFLREYFEQDEGYEKLEKAHRLDTIVCKSDPDNEPYKSKYLAREIWNEIKETLQRRAESLEVFDDLYKCTIATLDFRIGVNCIETEEHKAGEEFLSKILGNVADIKLNSLGYSIYTKSLSQLGFLYSIRAKHEDALNYLLEAMNLYDEYKHATDASPWRMQEFLTQHDSTEDIDKQRKEEMEDAYTHTLYYLAQVYGNLELRKQSAYYCNVTLKRQLDSNKYDPLDWSINTAALSQYFVTENNFKMARHLLASATLIFTEAFDKVMDELNENDMEDWRQKKADIERCWIKYGLELLEASQEKLVKEVEEMDSNRNEGNSSTVNEAVEQVLRSDCANCETETADASGATCEEDDEIKVKALMFDLELTQQEEKVTCDYLLDFSDARLVFLAIQQWIKSAQDFYTENEHCSDYIEITQDHSRAYKLLSFFEVDMERQCRMEKRRIDLLTSLLNDLNQQCYLQVCRQLQFEIAETYSSMMDLKFAIIELNNAQPAPHVLNKINHLARSSIQQYSAYLDTLKGTRSNLPDEFPEMDVRPGLVAMFCIGRLKGKLITPNSTEKIRNTRESLECFEFLVRYCERHSAAADLVKTELSVAKEMVTLLPLKIQRLQSID